MSQQAPVESPGGGYAPLPQRENAFLRALLQPRILLFMLAGWTLMSFVTELFVNSPLFVEAHNTNSVSLDGALGGLALNWEAIPLALLYIYCARDTHRFRGVFWLAFIAMAASVASNLYHLLNGTFSIESVFIPIVVSGGLGLLVFLNLFHPKEEQVQALKA